MAEDLRSPQKVRAAEPSCDLSLPALMASEEDLARYAELMPPPSRGKPTDEEKAALSVLAEQKTAFLKALSERTGISKGKLEKDLGKRRSA